MQLVIPARNEAARLPRTLEALRAHVLAAAESAGPLEVIVVDNGSTDDTARLAAAANTPGDAGAGASAATARQGRCGARGHRRSPRPTSSGFMDADGATHLDALPMPSG